MMSGQSSSATFLGSEKWDAYDYILKNKDYYNNIIIIGHSLGADNAVELSNIKANNYCDLNDCYSGAIDNEELYHTNIDDFLYTNVIADIKNVK